MRRGIYFLLLLAALMSGCGYSLRGTETNLSPEIRSVAIPIFANRTDQVGVETEVTRALVEKFISSRRLAVASRKSADSLLTGTVKGFTTAAVAVVTSTQVSTEYRATLTVEFSFQEQNQGKVLFREEMSEWRNYPVVADLNATELNKKEAIRKIAFLLAEKIHELVLGGF